MYVKIIGLQNCWSIQLYGTRLNGSSTPIFCCWPMVALHRILARQIIIRITSRITTKQSLLNLISYWRKYGFGVIPEVIWIRICLTRVHLLSPREILSTRWQSNQFCDNAYNHECRYRLGWKLKSCHISTTVVIKISEEIFR